jgi:hypothetical protein
MRVIDAAGTGRNPFQLTMLKSFLLVLLLQLLRSENGGCRMVESYVPVFQTDNAITQGHCRSTKTTAFVPYLKYVQVPIVVKESLSLYGVGDFNNADKNELELESEEEETEVDDKSESVQDVVAEFDHEETLLRIAMTIQIPQSQDSNGDIISSDDAMSGSLQLQDQAIEYVSKFCQSFPFAAVLPVQPLQYFPTPTRTDREKCIEVQFLRKKTPERGSMDGGIRFYIQPLHGLRKNSNDDEDDHTNEQDQRNYNNRIELIAKRNSQGQVITKHMAEQILIVNFVASFLGNTNTTTRFTGTSSDQDSTNTNVNTNQKRILQLPLRHPSPIAQNIVELQSMYHKWM